MTSILLFNIGAFTSRFPLIIQGIHQGHLFLELFNPKLRLSVVILLKFIYNKSTYKGVSLFFIKASKYPSTIWSRLADFSAIFD